MKITFTSLIIVFFIFSCQKKETIEVSTQKKVPIKKDSLELLFVECLDDGRFHNQFGKILYSDSIFFISSALGESELYLKGKLISKINILDYDEYDSISKKYNLKEMDILKFTSPSLNYQFEENSACTKLKSFNSKILDHSVMKSKSGTIFQYIVYENETTTLKICNSNSSYIFHLKTELSNSMSYIKLIDITGDGLEELFIFNNDFHFPALCFDVYQINHIE